LKAHPVPDRLATRAVERREVVRRFVLAADTQQLAPASAVLRTADGESSLLTRWPAGSARDPAQPLRERELHRGALRVDLVADRIARVRYAPGDAVPDNATPMVVGRFDAPADAVVRDEPERIVLEGGALRIEIEKKPLVLRLLGRDGSELARIGGPEKNRLNQWDSMNTGVCRSAEDGRPVAVECFALRPQEAIYGFGEKFLKLDKVGQTIDLEMAEAIGTTTPRSYKNVPFFWSTRGWGVFFNHSCRMTAWVGTLCAADVQLALEDDFLDYYLFAGDPKQILASYADVTGRPHLPPKWSFGFWQSKFSYRSADECDAVVSRNREAGVPMDVLHLDTHWFRRDWFCDLEFDPARFPDPAGWMKRLREQGVQVCLWQLPYIPEGSRLFDELAAVDGFVKTRTGTLYDIGICYTAGFEGRVGCIDFTHPDAKRVYQEHLRRLFDLGARAIKLDFGEQAPLDGVYHDGTPGHRAHNLYPLLYNQAGAEVTAEATGDWIVWARSAWAGSQRYPLHWGGDSSANWENLGPQLAGGLSFGLSGFPFWSQDIGGFIGETGGALLVRWLQAGLFLSHARIHGMGTRELPSFGGDVLRIGRAYLELRYRLLPYLYGTAIECAERAIPMARALVLEWPNDPTTWPIDDQWLLGDALLVAPILEPGERRRVYLPSGAWTDWWSGERLAGSRWIDVHADLETLPLYVREGHVVALGPALRWVDERPTDEIELRVAPFSGDGETLATVSVGTERIAVRYASRSGVQRIEIGAGPARFRVVPLGAAPPPIEVVAG
jgi:alpha-D-xyloside xylohydrolase